MKNKYNIHFILNILYIYIIFIVYPVVAEPIEIRINKWMIPTNRGLKTVEWYAPIEIIEKQVKWDPSTSDVPLSANQACILSLPRVKEEYPYVKEWDVEYIKLRNILFAVNSVMRLYKNVWCYEIKYEPKNKITKKRLAGLGGEHTIQVILLDKTIVTPIVRIQ